MTIYNDLNEPIRLKKNQVIAQIRSVITAPENRCEQSEIAIRQSIPTVNSNDTLSLALALALARARVIDHTYIILSWYQQ